MTDTAITSPPVPLTAAALLARSRARAQAWQRSCAALADTLCGGPNGDLVLSDRERSILLQLLRQIVSDIDATVRWLFVAQLEDGAGAGRAVWSTVAADGGALTFTTLLERGLLRDPQLMEAIAHRLWQHQLERTVRAQDRQRWTADSDLERPDDFLDLPIPKNSPLSRRIAAYIVDRSRRVDSYGHPVLLPAEIDPGLYGRLHWRVAAVLRDSLADASPGDTQLLDTLVETAALDAIGHSSAGASAPTVAVEAAASLQAAGLLTADTILRLLRAGEVSLFEAALARLTGLRCVLLRRLLYERGGEAVAVLARALGLGSDVAASICRTVRAAGSGFSRDQGDDPDAPLTLFERLSREEAERVRAYWARTPAFTAALWELETGGSGDVTGRR